MGTVGSVNKTDGYVFFPTLTQNVCPKIILTAEIFSIISLLKMVFFLKTGGILFCVVQKLGFWDKCLTVSAFLNKFQVACSAFLCKKKIQPTCCCFPLQTGKLKQLNQIQLAWRRDNIVEIVLGAFNFAQLLQPSFL